jgi:hypothetical protein
VKVSQPMSTELWADPPRVAADLGRGGRRFKSGPAWIRTSRRCMRVQEE